MLEKQLADRGYPRDVVINDRGCFNSLERPILLQERDRPEFRGVVG